MARDLSEGIVSIVDPEEDANLTIRFDPKIVTHCGLWLNYYGWAGKPLATPYYNVGFEPRIAMYRRS